MEIVRRMMIATSLLMPESRDARAIRQWASEVPNSSTLRLMAGCRAKFLVFREIDLQHQNRPRSPTDEFRTDFRH
jgi:hypothetical protein